MIQNNMYQNINIKLYTGIIIQSLALSIPVFIFFGFDAEKWTGLSKGIILFNWLISIYSGLAMIGKKE